MLWKLGNLFRIRESVPNLCLYLYQLFAQGGNGGYGSQFIDNTFVKAIFPQ